MRGFNPISVISVCVLICAETIMALAPPAISQTPHQSLAIALNPNGQHTPWVTYSKRLESTAQIIIDSLKDNPEGQPTVVDFGTGIPPITTLELALKLGQRAKVIGIDNLLPNCVLRSSRKFAAFDEQGNCLYAYDEKMRGRVLSNDEISKMAKMRAELISRNGLNNYSDETVSIIFNIHDEYAQKADNISFLLGDFEHLGLPEKSVDAIRIANVLRYYDNWAEKLILLSKLLKPGGIIVWFENAAESDFGTFRVYKKLRHSLVLMEMGMPFTPVINSSRRFDGVDPSGDILLLNDPFLSAAARASYQAYYQMRHKVNTEKEELLARTHEILLNAGFSVKTDDAGNLIFTYPYSCVMPPGKLPSIIQARQFNEITELEFLPSTSQ